MSDGASLTLTAYGQQRDALLARIVEVLEADPRVVAAWLSGSFGRGVADAWSDLDLRVAVEDDEFTAFLGDRAALYQAIGRPIQVQRDKPCNMMAASWFQRVMYPGPIEVDWSTGPVSAVSRSPETQMLFARRSIPVVTPAALDTTKICERAGNRLAFFWAMAPIAVKYAGRGESRRASSQIDLLTDAFIELWRLVMLPDGPDPSASFQNRATEPDRDAILPRLEWEITPFSALEVIRALCREVERLHPALAELGVAVPDELARETVAMTGLAESVIACGGSAHSRVYR
jgi:predicted nucleotidyltransferase